MPTPYRSNNIVENSTKAFAQTISWMAPGDGVNPQFDGVNVIERFFMEFPQQIPTGNNSICGQSPLEMTMNTTTLYQT